MLRVVEALASPDGVVEDHGGSSTQTNQFDELWPSMGAGPCHGWLVAGVPLASSLTACMPVSRMPISLQAGPELCRPNRTADGNARPPSHPPGHHRSSERPIIVRCICRSAGCGPHGHWRLQRCSRRSVCVSFRYGKVAASDGLRPSEIRNVWHCRGGRHLPNVRSRRLLPRISCKRRRNHTREVHKIGNE